MEPVFRQLAAEVARGGYVPVTSFASKCAAGGDRVVSSA